MSTLNVSNITNRTDTVSTETVTKGTAKAWVNFDGTGTVAIRDSFNVSSITDNGTGLYTVNFTNALSNADYSWTGGCSVATTTTTALVNVELLTGTALSSSMTTSSLAVEVVYVNPTITRTRFDGKFVSINVFGN